MDKSEKIEDFYKRKFDWLPENLVNEIGHFNIFKLDDFTGENAKPVPYKRRDFYKIMLVVGSSKVHYADKVVEIKKQALSFSNPKIPYKWEHLEDVRHGYFCIFDANFFHQFGDLTQYGVFQPNGEHIFELNDSQVDELDKVYQRMFTEIESDYIHKYDILRNQVSELIHYALKMNPKTLSINQESNASQRISMLFLELLERQFPIDEDHRSIGLRTASDFADQLNVHVNHLNRAVKEMTQRTTTEIIAERILTESKVLLKNSIWDIAEIAYALNFKEATHFSNFFKKHMSKTPSRFRSN